MKLRPKPNCRPRDVALYFMRLNQWRRKNGLRAYTWFYRTPEGGVGFGFKEDHAKWHEPSEA